jgi:very-short-patch-repair endonuclease
MVRDNRCAEVFESQLGLISRKQALQTGMSRAAISRRLAGQRWRQVLPGVYRLAGAPTSWEQSLKAATLWGGTGCAVSHESAAALHGLNGFRRGDIHIQCPKRLRHREVVTHRVHAGHSRPWTLVRGIAVTSVTRTLVDLAASLSPSSLEKAVDEAIRLRMTDTARLKRVLSRSGTHRRGARALWALMRARDGNAERSDSELEDRLLRLIRRHRLPLPALHFNAVEGDRWLGEIDFAYPRERIAIEAHGYHLHSLRPVWESDQRRENELIAAGWRVLKATHSQLEEQPGSFIEALRSLLRPSKSGGGRERCY